LAMNSQTELVSGGCAGRSPARRKTFDRDGVSSAAAAEIRALKRRNAELEQTIEILKAAAGNAFRPRSTDIELAGCFVGRARDCVIHRDCRLCKRDPRA
jgi:mRNA-degrading endonuclease YafQ of YafQ-DinJ toxin-antitoxin module